MSARVNTALLSLLCLSAATARAEEAAPATPVAEAKPAVPPAPEAHRNAGYMNGNFFLRSDDDNFVLIPSGRFQMDAFAYQGSGINRAPVSQFQARRARIELFGNIMKHWDFQLGSEFTGTGTALTDAFLNANYTPYANIQVGQFDAPFTMENRTSDKWMDLQERSTAVRAFGIPENKEIGAMVWGQPEGKWAHWSLGVFNGEGQNVAHRSNSYDIMGRAWIAPLALAKQEMFKNVWIGGSFWSGWRSATPANQVDHAAMRDQGGFTFFNPVNGTSHFGDYGQISKWAVELNAPIGPVVLKAEYIHGSEGVRELATTTNTVLRNGTMAGDGMYVRVSYFLWGDPLINGLAGMQVPPRLYGELKQPKTATALQLVAEYDHTFFTYSAPSEAGPSGGSKFVGNYGLNTVTLGVNYWMTRHIRLTGNFVHNTFLGSSVTPLNNNNSANEFTLRAALAI